VGPSINKNNVGRIAERIVSNELEYRGFRVSDLNKEGNAANADLLAAKDGKTWQIQVKGCTEEDGWWFGYGHCTDAVIARKSRMFNRSNNFYKAEIVVLLCVKSPREYTMLVLPVAVAEEAAQVNLDGYFRRPKKDGGVHKPGRMYIAIDHPPQKSDSVTKEFYEKERSLLQPYRDNWEWLENQIKEDLPENAPGAVNGL
jgi:hypothetical protein